MNRINRAIEVFNTSADKFIDTLYALREECQGEGFVHASEIIEAFKSDMMFELHGFRTEVLTRLDKEYDASTFEPTLKDYILRVLSWGRELINWMEDLLLEEDEN